MKIKHNIVLLAMLLLTASRSFGQYTLQRSVMSTAGSNASSGTYELSYTTGQIGTRSTSPQGPYTLSEGFQQGDLTVTAVDEQLAMFSESRIYPVPTANVLHVEPNLPQSGSKTQLRLVSLTGEILQVPQDKDAAGNYTLDLHALAAGTYFLWISDVKTGQQQSWKVSKIR